MSDTHLHVIVDDDLGAIAAAVDEDGQIVATASSHIDQGVYVAVDEAAVYAATGELMPLPAELWDQARCRCEGD